MESKNGKSVILTEDGTFRTVKGNYSVGWEFDYKVPLSSNRKMTSRIAAAAACLFMMLSMGTYSYQNLMVYATVTLHGTAPIQLELNRHDKVIGVKAIDESGEALAEQLLDSGIRGEKLEDAVAKAEQVILAQKDTDNSKPLLPQVKCKSSDKLKALTDKLRQGEAASVEKAPKTEPSGTTATTTSAPEKTADVSAQEAEKTEETTTAETTTQPSSSEEQMEGQEETEDLSAQEESTEAVEMTAQEAVDTPAPAETQEAPAKDEAPADAPAPADEADSADAE